MDSIKEKIKKILSVGSRTKEEAEIFMAKAKALAVAHNIDLAALNVEEAPEEYIEDKFSTGEKRLKISQNFVTKVLSTHFKVSILYSTRNRSWGTTIYFLGKTSDVETAKYLNDYLNDAFSSAWKSVAKEKNLPTKDKRAFYLGMQRGICDKLYVANKEAKQEKLKFIENTQGAEISSQTAARYELMVKTDQENLNAFLEKKYPKLGNRSHSSYSVKTDALRAGYEVGQKLNVSSQRKGQLALN